MTATELRELIEYAMRNDDECRDETKTIRPFEEAGMLTRTSRIENKIELYLKK